MFLFLILFCIFNVFAEDSENKTKLKLSAGGDFSSFVTTKNLNLNFNGDATINHFKTNFLLTQATQISTTYFEKNTLFKSNSKLSLMDHFQLLGYLMSYNYDSSLIAISFDDKIESIGIGYSYNGFVSSISSGLRQNNYGSGEIIRLATSYQKKLLDDIHLKAEIAYLYFIGYSQLEQFSLKVNKDVNKYIEILLLIDYDIEQGLPTTLINKTATNSQIIQRQKVSFGVNFKL